MGEELFIFDHVMGPEISQSQMYDTLVEPLIKKIFEGFQCTVMAYGQSGSGKSYTMGLNPDVSKLALVLAKMQNTELDQNIFDVLGIRR